MRQRRIGSVDRIAIAVGGLMPFAGVLILGWDIATAIFFLMADAVLVSLRLVPAVIVEDYEEGRSKMPVLEFPFLVAGALVGWGLFVLPVLAVAGVVLDGLVAPHHPGGVLEVARHMVLVEPWWLGLLALARVVQCVFDFLHAKSAGKGAVMDLVTAQGALLLLKAIVIGALLGVANRFVASGPGTLLVLFGLASLVQVWMESRAGDWFPPESKGGSLPDGTRARISDVEKP